MTTKKKTVLPDRYLRSFREGMVGPYGEENVCVANKKSSLLMALQGGLEGGILVDDRGFLAPDYETIVDLLLQYISDLDISAAVKVIQDRY